MSTQKGRAAVPANPQLGDPDGKRGDATPRADSGRRPDVAIPAELYEQLYRTIVLGGTLVYCEAMTAEGPEEFAAYPDECRKLTRELLDLADKLTVRQLAERNCERGECMGTCPACHEAAKGGAA